jgi:pyroglutamyl-peptidase
MTCLLTGFEPFRQWTVNSSGEVAKALAGQPGLVTSVLPVDHQRAAEALGALVAQHRPHAILATGLSPRPVPRLELRARRPEAFDAGAAELWGVWPWAASLAAIRATGAPITLSTDAGRYVCETVYWAALAQRQAATGPLPVAFLHMPPLGGAWTVDRLAAVVAAALSALGGAPSTGDVP